MTTPAPLICPKCRSDLGEETAQPAVERSCPSCKRPVELLVFPAYRRPAAVASSVEAVIAAEDAGCFYHPQSRARQVCDICGRFLCALCDVELQARHVCPGCVGSKRGKTHISHLDGDRMLYGGMALLLAVVPALVLWPVTIITGPLAVFVAIYGWNKPQSLTGARRFSFVLAIIIGLTETILFGLFFATLFKVF